MSEAVAETDAHIAAAEAYDKKVRGAEVVYAAEYDRARASYDAKVAAAAAELEAEVAADRQVRDAAVTLALAEYEQAVGIVREQAVDGTPVVDLVDGDTASGQEGVA